MNHDSFENLSLANSISFYVVNWIALLILVWLVYRIRHTSDDTNLKRECMSIVAVWVLCSIFQYTIIIYNWSVECKIDAGHISEFELTNRYKVSYKIIYWLIMARDTSCILIMVIFQYKASTS